MSVRPRPWKVADVASIVADIQCRRPERGRPKILYDLRFCVVEAMGLEPTNLLTASQALYQLSYAPSGEVRR
jgi:hypothetical protein